MVGLYYQKLWPKGGFQEKSLWWWGGGKGGESVAGSWRNGIGGNLRHG